MFPRYNLNSSTPVRIDALPVVSRQYYGSNDNGARIRDVKPVDVGQNFQKRKMIYTAVVALIGYLVAREAFSQDNSKALMLAIAAGAVANVAAMRYPSIVLMHFE